LAFLFSSKFKILKGWVETIILVHIKFHIDHPADHGEDEHGIACVHPDCENDIFLPLFTRFYFGFFFLHLFSFQAVIIVNSKYG
jgi:hypothetical protein